MLEIIAVLLLACAAVWIAHNGGLLWVAGVDPMYVQTVADRARYTSVGAIVVLTATAATASLTTALALVFAGHGWLTFLPVGLLWGTIVFSFDRWIVSSVDYGPLQAAEKTRAAHRSRQMSKGVQFLVRLIMAGLVGLIISEPIVLAVFGPEISQQLTAQHALDAGGQTAQLNAAQHEQLAVLNGPVKSADAALASATAAADNARIIYICELTGKCSGLPAGTVTGTPGDGPQAAQDYAVWQRALSQQQQAQQVADQASASERAAAAALAVQTKARIQAATTTVYSDNGLLAREKALDTLSQQNSGFLMRRIILWLALMFVDLAPVLLKTFSPRTLYEVRVRSEAIRIGRNLISDTEAERDHESAKKAINREFELDYHRTITGLEYSLRLEAARSQGHSGVGSQDPAGGMPTERLGASSSNGGSASGTRMNSSPDNGWVIGHRWHIQRPLAGNPNQAQVPFVAIDLSGEYPFEVVVKVIAPPPSVAGIQATRERHHALMEMSLLQGHIHDNIAEILDSGLDPEHGFYIVTRLYPQTLEQYLQAAERQHSLTVGQVLDLAVQVLAGLQAAWDRGFVHLDLKPANIAIDQHERVKLIDFGLAQQYQKADGGNDATMTTARFTLFYAPPEQMERRNASWINRNADLRALGAVIYRMLTGFPPLFREAQAIGLVDAAGRFDASAYIDIKKLVASTEAVPVVELNPDVPQELDLLLRTWLHTDPRMRCPGNPRTMAERARAELGAVLDQVQADGRSHDPVGPWLVRRPEFSSLRAQWPGHPSAQLAAIKDARSRETLEVVESARGRAPVVTDQEPEFPEISSSSALSWWSNDNDVA